MGPQKGTKWHTLAILRHPQTQCADRCVIKQFINAKTKEKPNSHHACVTYLVPIKCVGTTYQIKHHWYIILDTVCWYSSPIGGLYIYIWAKQRARSPRVCSEPATPPALLPLPSPYLLVQYANTTGSKVHSCAHFAERIGVAPAHAPQPRVIRALTTELPLCCRNIMMSSPAQCRYSPWPTYLGR